MRGPGRNSLISRNGSASDPRPPVCSYGGREDRELVHGTLFRALGGPRRRRLGHRPGVVRREALRHPGPDAQPEADFREHPEQDLLAASAWGVTTAARRLSFQAVMNLREGSAYANLVGVPSIEKPERHASRPAIPRTATSSTSSRAVPGIYRRPNAADRHAADRRADSRHQALDRNRRAQQLRSPHS